MVVRWYLAVRFACQNKLGSLGKNGGHANARRFVVFEPNNVIRSIKAELTYTRVDGYQDSEPECWDNVNET